ncbi:MAG: EamA family transporter [Pseudomonadota bacterium]|nr:EamA family transporter [Pseudomonadota bacterium]
MSIVFLFVSALCWTFFDFARKKLVASETPLALTVAFNVGAIPLYCLAFFLSAEHDSLALVNDISDLNLSYWIPSFVAAGLAALAAVGFITALKLGDIARVIPVLALTPVISTLAAGWLLGESLNLSQWLAMSVTVIAIAGAQGGLHHVRGKPFLLMLLVCLGWGTGIVFDKQALSHSGPFFHGIVQTILGSLLLLAYALISSTSVRVRSGVLRLLPALVVFVAAVVFQWFALSGLDAGIVETVKRSVGIIGALLGGLLLFKEAITKSQVLWCLVILACIPVILQPEV